MSEGTPRPRQSINHMPASRKPIAHKRRGASRRSVPDSALGKDRWLNRLLDIAVASALLIGSAALLLSQF